MGDQVAAILQDEAVDMTHVVRQGSTKLVTVPVDQKSIMRLQANSAKKGRRGTQCADFDGN